MERAGMIEERRRTPKQMQFDASTVSEAFGAQLLSEEACREWVLKQIHGDCPSCPRCGQPVRDNLLPRFMENKRIQCSCGKLFQGTSQTFVSGMHMTFSELILLALLLWLRRDITEISRTLKMDPETVRLWKARFDNVRILSSTDSRGADGR